MTLPLPVLVADIGGTHARFALVTEERTTALAPVRTRDHASVADAIASMLAGRTPPRSAMLALAGPVKDETVRLTNAEWTIDPRSLLERFDLAEVLLINDFEALAMALPELQGGDLMAIGGRLPGGPGVKVVVGPGTGLGAAALIPAGDFLVPVAGEGGHMDLGPRDDRDRALWRVLAPKNERISAEMLISGPGLVRLYRAVCQAMGAAVAFDTPEAIVAAGLAGKDAAAREAVDVFATYLGRFAGNLAVLFMAKGGVYLAGGVTEALAPFLGSSRFREAFADKAPHNALLAGMATAVITHKAPALAGLAAYVRHPLRFRLNLEGRRWTRGR
ncbi:MAG: ROK family protein [Bauldia sp.]